MVLLWLDALIHECLGVRGYVALPGSASFRALLSILTSFAASCLLLLGEEGRERTVRYTFIKTR
jgi:hypothetical protein